MIETLQRIAEPLPGSNVSQGYPSFDQNVDATHVFCEELNKRSIMPMELMQARANPKFAETAERVHGEYQAMKIAHRENSPVCKGQTS